MGSSHSNFNRLLRKGLIYPLLLIFSFFIFPVPKVLANHAVISIAPATGSFQIGSTFEASVFLDTHDQSVNTVELSIKYPPDKLQLVSSSTGKSIIGLWASLPKFNNQTGTLELTGGIPGGIKVSRGLITTLTFRVKAIGSAVVKIEKSQVLMNDGQGTELLTQHQNSIYNLILPPPAGPIIVSDTHPNQEAWYRNTTATLQWGDEAGIEGFSYMLSDFPTEIPDDISEGTQRSVVYPNLSEARHYFHIKALRDKQWGGVSHYALNIDALAPAEFKIEVVPSARTSRRQPVFEFETTDAASGISHYELKLIPLNGSFEGQELFIEAQSPFVSSELENGKYDIIVRAFDFAGNVREVTQRLVITSVLFHSIDGRGLQFKSTLIIPWAIIWILLAIVLLSLGYVAYRMRKHHRDLHKMVETGSLPPHLDQQMTELQKYRERYGKIILLFLSLSISFAISTEVLAQEKVLTPPIVTSFSKNITNEDIFYIGGTSSVKDSLIELYLQSSETGSVIKETVEVDEKGEWFYRHDTFLNPGSYILWAQAKFGATLSPPSPQVEIKVDKTAIQIGSSRLSLATIYLMIIGLLLLITLGLIIYTIHHYRHGRKKKRLVQEKVFEAHSSIKRGFALINRDLQQELEIVKQAKLAKSLSDEEKRWEEQLLRDLAEIEQHLEKEIWDIEKSER